MMANNLPPAAKKMIDRGNISPDASVLQGENTILTAVRGGEEIVSSH
jgi:hypothetical protein